MRSRNYLHLIAISIGLAAIGCSNSYEDRSALSRTKNAGTTSESTTSADSGAVGSVSETEIAPVTTSKAHSSVKKAKAKRHRKVAAAATSSSATQAPSVSAPREPASNVWEDGSRVRNENSTNNYQFKYATSPPGQNSL